MTWIVCCFWIGKKINPFFRVLPACLPVVDIEAWIVVRSDTVHCHNHHVLLQMTIAAIALSSSQRADLKNERWFLDGVSPRRREVREVYTSPLIIIWSLFSTWLWFRYFIFPFFHTNNYIFWISLDYFLLNNIIFMW